MELANKQDSLGEHSEDLKHKNDAEVRGSVGEGAVPALASPKGNAEKARVARESRQQKGGQIEAGKDKRESGGGVPLPDDIRRRMEKKLHADFSKVKIHKGGEHADAMNAHAFTQGTDIFFAPGQGPENEHVLAHELTHVIQQGGAPATARDAKDGKVGERGDATEKEAESVADAVKDGKEAPEVKQKDASGATRRFGAGKYGHGGIEAEAGTGEKEPDAADPRAEGVKEMYSGNFMRDMNQVNVPLIIEGLQGLPKDPLMSPKGAAIGAKGAHDITTSVIQALAILELGPKVAETLVTGGEIDKGGNKTEDHIGSYKTEEHIDNPMGTGDADLIVNNSDPNAKDKKGNKIEVGAPRPAEGTVATHPGPDGKDLATLGAGGAAVKPADADRDAQEKGSAFDKGQQVENQNLYKVSDEGLSNHIFNSSEATKHRWLKAADLGPTPLGRSEYGAGSHAVEDYFSHSNFVEVGLNSYIRDALQSKGKKGENKAATKFADTVVDSNNTKGGEAGKTKQGYYVDTLYDAKVDDKKGPKGNKKRQAITTGSFGGDDSKVSIAHILLPGLPKLQDALMKAVDQMFGIADASGGEGGWSHISAMLSGTPQGAAAVRILEGFNSEGMVAPVPDITLKWKTMPVSPGLFGKPWTVSIPYGLDHSTSSVPIGQAVTTYAGIYKKAKDMVAIVQKAAALAKKLLIPLDWLVELIQAEVQKIEQTIKKAIKSQVSAGLVAIVDSLSGRTAKEKADAKKTGTPADAKDPDGEFKKDLGDALNYFHEGVEKIEEKTSIESRLKNGDLSKMPQERVEALVGPVKKIHTQTTDSNGKVVQRDYYESVNPLPPSHSEISKDHEPYSEHDKKGGDGDLDRHKDPKADAGDAQGSAFFGLARSLALEAVKHNDAQLQVVWQSRGTVFGDKDAYKYKSEIDPANSDKIQAGVQAAADQRAKDEEKRSKADGSHFAQRDAEGKEKDTMQMTGVQQLMNLVDLFISHPDDSTWWKPIFDAYIAKDPESVYQGIIRRNKTREERNLK